MKTALPQFEGDDLPTDEATALAERSWLDELPEHIPGSEALEPGRIIWLHGVSAGKVSSPGVWYAKASELPETPPPPWVMDDRFEDEIGYSAEQLRIAVVGWRSQWHIPGDKKTGRRTVWITDYDREVKGREDELKAQSLKVSKLTEILILVEGINDPMVLSVSGMYKAQPIIEAIKDYDYNLRKAGSRLVGRTVPRWAYWLPIGNPTRDGKTVYLKATDRAGTEYGSIVTPPKVTYPDGAVRSLAVPLAVLARGEQLRQEYGGWFKAKRHNRDRDAIEAEFEVEEFPALPAPAGKNVPQLLTDDDIPEF